MPDGPAGSDGPASDTGPGASPRAGPPGVPPGGPPGVPAPPPGAFPPPGEVFPAPAEVFQALPDLLVALTADHVLAYVSPRSVEMLGQHPDRLVGGELAGWIHPDDLGDLLRGLGGLREAGDTVRLLLRARGSSGYRWLEALAARVGQRRPPPAVQVLLSCRDASALAQLEERAVTASLRAATVVECVEEGVVVLDAGGRVVSCSARAAQVLRRPAASLLGSDLVTAVGLRVDGGGPPPWPRAGPGEPPPTGTGPVLWCRSLAEDGRRLVLQVRAAPLPGPAGAAASGTLVLLRGVGAADTRPVVARTGRMREAAGLSRREGDILELLADGAAVADIAARLHLSPHTVRGHVKALMLKFGVHNQLQVVVWAARHGLVDFRSR